MRRWLCVTGALVLAGCAETVAGSGGGPHGDGGMADADAGGDSGVTPGAPCTEAATVDGNATGRRLGRTTSVFVASSQWARGVSLPTSEGCGPDGGGDRQVVVRYVMQGDAWLTARLERAGVSSDVVGRLLLLDRCGAGARRLACAGRIESEHAPLASSPRTVTSPARFARGQAVYFAATGDATDVLFTVTEVDAPRGLGQACDPGGTADRCPDGSTCAGAPGVCVPDGVEEARCRRAGAPCDDGLTCFFATREGHPGVCLRRAAPGASCGANLPCLGGPCSTEPGARCPALGGPYGPCRAEGTRCDEGLTCAGGPGGELCVRALAAGARCSPRRGETACAAGSRRALLDDAWRCAPDGTAGAACRPRAPRCDAGLVCGDRGSRCVPGRSPSTPGEPCDATVGADACAPGLRCVGGRCAALGEPGAPCAQDGTIACAAGSSCVGPAPTTRCVADGARGGACRHGSSPCDAGLACNVAVQCAAAAATGAMCSAEAACATADRCAGTCRAPGTEEGWCRPGPAPCDDGLACASGGAGDAPFCVRTLASGDLCRGGSDPRLRPRCPAGEECRPVDDGGQWRCATPAFAPVACSSDRGGPAACPAGTACARGLCLALAATGAPCSPAVTCGPGSTCGGPEPALLDRCIPDGSLGGRCRASGAPCEASLGCARDVNGWRTCVSGGRPGAPCGSGPAPRCADGLSCFDGACVAEGSRGGACRASDVPCDGGLACDGDRCIDGAPRGAPCADAACADGLACATTGAEAPTCGEGAYAMTVRRDVAFEDPCDLPPTETASPFVFRFFGVRYTARMSAAGESYLTAAGRPANQSSIDLGSLGRFALDDPQQDAVCARITGDAPARRLVLGGGYSGPRSFESSLAWSLTLHEGSDRLEVRLRARGFRASTVPAVRVRLGADGVARYVSAAFANAPGTAVTLTPR